MRIDDIRPNASRSDRNLPLTPVTGPAPNRAPERITRDRDDQVQISDAGRALAAQQADSADSADALSPERVAELRRWVQSGAFNEPSVVEQVARRLLSSGEV